MLGNDLSYFMRRLMLSISARQVRIYNFNFRRLENKCVLQSCVTHCKTGSLQFPLGFHVAACVRVGNALGAGNTTRAIITCKVALVLSGMKTNYIHNYYNLNRAL